MEEPRGENVKMEIELHFENKAELLIERSIDNSNKIVINAGGLKLELQSTDFLYQVLRMIKEDYLR